jgi:SPX domain protein involved in polyphosphate accumulation
MISTGRSNYPEILKKIWLPILELLPFFRQIFKMLILFVFYLYQILLGTYRGNVKITINNSSLKLKNIMAREFFYWLLSLEVVWHRKSHHRSIPCLAIIWDSQQENIYRTLCNYYSEIKENSHFDTRCLVQDVVSPLYDFKGMVWFPVPYNFFLRRS